MFSWYPPIEYIVFASSMRSSRSGSLLTSFSSFSFRLKSKDCPLRSFGVDSDFVLLIATENLSHKKCVIIENNEILSVLDDQSNILQS